MWTCFLGPLEYFRTWSFRVLCREQLIDWLMSDFLLYVINWNPYHILASMPLSTILSGGMMRGRYYLRNHRNSHFTQSNGFNFWTFSLVAGSCLQIRADFQNTRAVSSFFADDNHNCNAVVLQPSTPPSLLKMCAKLKINTRKKS